MTAKEIRQKLIIQMGNKEDGMQIYHQVQRSLREERKYLNTIETIEVIRNDYQDPNFDGNEEYKVVHLLINGMLCETCLLEGGTTMKSFNNLYGTIELKKREGGQMLPSPKELSIFFDGFRIKTSKGQFDLYEDNNCDFSYDFTPIGGGYRIEFKVKGANWYQMEGLDREVDWEADKLDISLDDVFEEKDIANKKIEIPVLEAVFDICDDNDKSYVSENYDIKVTSFSIDEWIGDNLREISLVNSKPEETLYI